jgi:hypothetical protein
MAQTCQHCGTTVDDDDRVMCPSCGRRIRPGDENVPQPATPPAPAAGLPPAPRLPTEPYAPSPYPPAFGEPGTTTYGVPPPGTPPYGRVGSEGDDGTVSPWGRPPSTEPPRPQVYVSRAAQERTSRPTVAFRFILIIPHLIVLWFVGIAATVVGTIAWFAALFTGRVPQGMYDFLAWVVGYGTRVWAYGALLTDRWPTFGGNDPYPVAVWLPGPDRVNRAAVFFRFILIFPAYFMAAWTALGLVIAGPILWLIILIKGRIPRPVFNSTAAVLRYQTRYWAYAHLLTAAWPAGLFGDPKDRREGDTVAGDDAPPDAPRPPVLHGSARRLVTTYVVLGVLGFLGYVALSVALSGSFQARLADRQLTDAYRTVAADSQTSCQSAVDQLDCSIRLVRRDAATLDAFDRTLDDIVFPSDTDAEVTEVHRDVARLVDDYDQLSRATSLAAYRTLARQLNLVSDNIAVDSAVQALHDKLKRES